MSDLLKETVRKTVFMMVPVVAFLAILSAVALFAVPRPQTDGQRPSVEAESSASAPAIPNARAAVRPNKM